MSLSSGEAEYYALVKGASHGMGVSRLMEDLGVECVERVQLLSDA